MKGAMQDITKRDTCKGFIQEVIYREEFLTYEKAYLGQYL